MKPTTKFWVGVVTLCYLATTSPVQAQIASDGTLSTNVNKLTNKRFTIDGGMRAGPNLFHSFSEFSVPKKGSVLFNNALDVQNIISRVTGESVSNIDGKLKANGTANLFLLNPNGVIFGPNASLDIGGSFVASTASSLNFDDGTRFSATAPQTTPLLTMSVPIGLQFGSNPASIRNRSQALNSSDELVGLQVKLGETLALVGGDVKLEGGRLTAAGGRVELGGVAKPGTVKLNGSGNNLSLSFPDKVDRANVSLTDGARVDVTARGGGSIAVNAQNIDILGGSSLNAGIASGLKTSSEAGDITLNAIEELTVEGSKGSRSNISNSVQSRAKGKAGDINITAGSLQVNDAELGTKTSGQQRKAGNISVHARDSVSLENSIFSTGNSGARSDGGDITITTDESLSLTKSRLTASTSGKGNAGNVTIKADTVFLKRGSAVRSGVGKNAVGKGGDITITTTGLLSLTERSQLITTTTGQGIAGNVTINADTVSLEGGIQNKKGNFVPSGIFATVEQGAVGKGGTIDITTGELSLTKGAELVVSTFGQGIAGSVTINADTVSLEGEGQNSDGSPSPSGIFATVGRKAIGKGGTITITTGELSLAERGRLVTTTRGQGNAGDIKIKAETVSLKGVGRDSDGDPTGGIFSSVDTEANVSGGDITLNTTNLSVMDGAGISANTTFGNGGNITLQVQKLLQLSGSSTISTTAGTRQAVGNGGNINVNAPLIFAVPSGNSDITANAFTGNGGRVDITTQGIFGIEFREVQNPREKQTNDITASSMFGVSGTVNLNTLIDPRQGLITLPEEVTDASDQIAQGCSSGGTVSKEESTFVVTGRGGLPPNPNEPLSSDTVLADWVTIDPKTEETPHSGPAPSVSQPNSTPAPMEAQGWVRGPGGQVILTAQAPIVTPHSPGPTPTSCRGS